jgi:hypothetical protein
MDEKHKRKLPVSGALTVRAGNQGPTYSSSRDFPAFEDSTDLLIARKPELGPVFTASVKYRRIIYGS